MNPSSLNLSSSDPSSLTTELLSGYQNDRLLRLHTLLDEQYGPDTLIPESVQCREVISSQPESEQPSHTNQWDNWAPKAKPAQVTGYRIELTALSHQPNIPLNSALGQPVLLELLTAQSRTELRPFHGHLTRFERLESDGTLTRYRLTIEPWLSLLRYRMDSTIYQDKTVIEILEAVFEDGTGEGAYLPTWRFDLADPSVYPKRSLTTQYQETDLDFINRLMAEEGLYYWFAHEGDPDSAHLGQHTLVIADHNDAFKDNAQPLIPYAQSSTVLLVDSIDRWQEQHTLATQQIKTVSWDYRAHKMVTMECVDDSPSAMAAQSNLNQILSREDAPGQYAHSNTEQAKRLAYIALDAIRTRRHSFSAEGTVRTAAPGTRFTLTGYNYGAIDPDADPSHGREYLITEVSHEAHNNFTAHLRSDNASDSDEYRYRNTLKLIPVSTIYRSQTTDAHGVQIHPKPTVHGQQTAIVVGDDSGNPIHTDRDHRIKIQFHWQRGDTSHSRLMHPYPEDHTNAPGDTNAGTWVRVLANLAPIAGDNWGSVQVPRVGQEVLVDFIEGDIDRPIVIASLYNGQGQSNAPYNKINSAAPTATANAPAWFAGDQNTHNHPASISGIKTQSLSASQTGDSGYNQFVFDDTANQSRISLQQHSEIHNGSSELNLGHLYHQSDNQRQHHTGHGLELKTIHSAAIRAGSGLLLSSHASSVNGMQMDSEPASALLQRHYDLNVALAETAHAHLSNVSTDPEPEKLPAIDKLKHSQTVISDRTNIGSADGSEVASYSEPHLQLASPAGVIAATATNAVFSAGVTSSLTAEHDISTNSQGQQHHAVKDGIQLFTQGLATDKNKPNQETGIRLHAAQGKFSSQSQSGETRINAAKTVHIMSTQQDITIAAPDHLLLTAQGAYIKIEGGNIEVHGPGVMAFNASMSELAGPASAGAGGVALPQPGNLYDEQFQVTDKQTGKPMAYYKYRIVNDQGQELTRGITDHEGYATRVITGQAKNIHILPDEE